MKVDIKDYELIKDMAYDSREKFQMLHAKMLLIKEGESTLKEMYYDLVEKYQRKKQECEKVESRADELKNTLQTLEKKRNEETLNAMQTLQNQFCLRLKETQSEKD